MFIEGRGALKRELVTCLRTAARCGSLGRGRRTSRKGMSPRMSSSQRPVEAADRAVPGHWESQ